MAGEPPRPPARAHPRRRPPAEGEGGPTPWAPDGGPHRSRDGRRPLAGRGIAVALVLLGGGLAVALGIGRTEAPPPDSVDAGFSRDMGRHHLQGVEMANLARDRSDGPRGPADSRSTSPRPRPTRPVGCRAGCALGPAADGRRHHGVDGRLARGARTATGGGGLMPGMATEEELAYLRGLSGPAFDVEFLRLMIRHHQGGTDMAEYAAEHADARGRPDLADSIVQSQTAETTMMARMLAARGGTPLPAP